ncbi:MAG: beta-L-arabinofuranosidase domain-containing protein [Opitutaceae bacterium]|jgi:hypothetical protein
MFLFSPLPSHQVRLNDPFWSERLRVNHEQSLPAQYDLLLRTGRIDALRLQWHPGSALPKPHIFWDSDTAKWLEAACYACRLRPDESLRQKIDEVAALFIAAQQPDGYLNSHFTVVRPQDRWSNLGYDHELYCAGHLIEAAVAHHQLTGTDTLLTTACRFADLIATVFGTGEGQLRGYCGHEEIELALVRLYHATGEPRYLALATYFVEERGRAPNWFQVEAETRARSSRGNAPMMRFPLDYYQAHLPVREQEEVTGHAVRAVYLYCAMTDLARDLGDASLLDACRRLWTNLSHHKLYLTGGIGSSKEGGECFTQNYDLPNQTAYCETCASVGLVFWAHRMLQAEGGAAYAEVIERALYNGALSGMSLDGRKFFYENPLASLGTHHRQEWFECSCCPSNLSRLLGSLGSYVYSESEDTLLVHLYISGECTFTLGNGISGTLRQSGDSPWQGRVRFEITTDQTTSWTLGLRVPEWSSGFTVHINGQISAFAAEKGYASLNRIWQTGDVVDATFDLPVRRLEGHPMLTATAGHTAIQRGPFVYCVEDADVEPSVLDLSLPPDTSLTSRHDENLLGGVVVVEGTAVTRAPADTNALYRPVCHALPGRPTPFRAVPYFTWDNRRPGAMRVWIPKA